MFGPKAYIHTKRFENNISNIQTYVGNKNLMLVVKANAYGHNIIDIASLIFNKPWLILCVFTIQEAIQLRDLGLKNKILIFSRLEKEWLYLAVKNKISVNLSNLKDFETISAFYNKTKSCPFFHLKFDTGMTRLGFCRSELKYVLDFLEKNRVLPLEGIYSHFATADEGDITYSEHQLDQFKTILDFIKEIDLSINYIHFSNSGSIINIPHSSYNLVRVGMLLYGAYPSYEVSKDIPIKPVMEFKGPVVSLRNIKAGTKVSYGGVWEAPKDTIIGVIQTGFADGFPREWYINGYISLKGKKYPIAGRVCMDQFMVDFGDAEVKIGDEVLIFGQNNKDKILVDDIAKDIKSTSYVILSNIGGRTERKYIN